MRKHANKRIIFVQRFFLFSFILMGVTSSPDRMSPAGMAGNDEENPSWLTDYDRALELARREKKPLFVVFRCEH